jgi:hypothetical protein
MCYLLLGSERRNTEEDGLYVTTSSHSMTPKLIPITSAQRGEAEQDRRGNPIGRGSSVGAATLTGTMLTWCEKTLVVVRS